MSELLLLNPPSALETLLTTGKTQGTLVVEMP